MRKICSWAIDVPDVTPPKTLPVFASSDNVVVLDGVGEDDLRDVVVLAHVDVLVGVVEVPDPSDCKTVDVYAVLHK